MVPHGFFDPCYTSWIQMTDPPDDAVLINGLDLLGLIKSIVKLIHAHNISAIY